MPFDFDPAALPRPTADPRRQRADLDEFGYCLVAGALSPAQTAAARERLEEQAAAEREQRPQVRQEAHEDAVNQWVPMLINKGEIFEQMAQNPACLDLAGHVLGREFLLSVFEAHIVRRGGAPMPLHCDQWWMPYPAAPDAAYRRLGDITRRTVGTGRPERAAGPVWLPGVVNVMFMLTDFTEANGGTRLVPGSHLSGVQPEGSIPHPCHTVAAEGAAGTAVVWEGRTWHAAGENRTDGARIGVTTYYCGPMFRQLSNFTVGTRDEVLARATPRLKRLLGFSPWSTYGSVDDPAAEFVDRDEVPLGVLRPAHGGGGA